MKKTLLSTFLLSLLLLSTSSFAQQTSTTAKQQPTAQPAPTPVEKKKTETSENDIGNLRREGIDVVQNRIFIKGKRHEFGLGVGFIFDDPFLRYELAEFRYTYHFNEGLAIEGAYSYAFHQNKALVTDLANIPCDGTLFDAAGNPLTDPECGVILDPAPDPYKHIFNANLVWSPIYGKFSIFSKKILHFDIFATAGGGYYMADVDNRFGINIGIGSKIFVNEWSAVRIDFRNITIKEGAPFNHIVNNRILSLGMSFFFPTKIAREQ